VQDTVQTVLGRALRIDPPVVTVAGRTDAGVHARGQVCSLDVAGVVTDVEQLRTRLNRALPPDVVVRRVSTVAGDFDARFSALWRRYAYRICDDDAARNPLTRGSVLWWPRHLDEAMMNAAASRLLGEHDFAAFCRRREGASTVRCLREVSWSRTDGVLACRVVADSFCHNMVRSLIGCLVVVGEGKRPVKWPAEVLAAAVRDPRVPVLAAHGLTLEEVGYPPA
jgi:tRNA pseudouridine38-40 synthase